MVTGKSIGGTQIAAPESRLSREEALRLYTVGSAWFSGEEKLKGRIAPGQYADFAILSDDYLDVPDEGIRTIESVLTVTGGDVVYAAAPFAALAPDPIPPVTPAWSSVAVFGGYQQDARRPTLAAADSLTCRRQLNHKEQIMSNPARIDVHQHVVPPIWAESLASHGGDPTGSAMPRWTPELAIEFMDSQQIATGILSLTLPSVVGWAETERRNMARRVNEYTAGLVAAWPPRFGNFATLPLPDIDGAVEEIDYAFGALGADGVTLLANYDGTYLGDPTLEPLWEALDRHEAVVFVHPGEPPAKSVAGVASPIVDVLLDTTRTAVQLVLNGTIDRHPRARIILAHAGGYLPYASMRFAELARVFRPDSPSPDELMANFKRFYFDTALSSGSALPSLHAFAPSGHTLFGSDFPYAPADVAAPFTAAIDASLTAADQAAVNHTNASDLFPRLAGLGHAARANNPTGVIA